MRFSKCVCLGVVCLGLCCGAAHAAPVTFESLLKEMTDLSGLAQFPNPAYTCKQFSSYDRRSTDPAALTDENWFANGDCGQFLRTENSTWFGLKKEYVLMDTDGPGAIVRFWSANANDAGDVHIYIDGAEEPALTVSLENWLGGKEKIAPPPISCELSKGWNNYLPIPYAKHCKVTTTKGGFYYHINYRTYAPGTEVEPFSLALAEKNQATIDAVAARLAAPDAAPALPADAVTQPYESELDGGESSTLTFAGPAMMARFTCKVTAENMEDTLRGCLLEIAFDGMTPAIITPLGDFFGAAPGLNPYKSLPSGVLDDGTMYCQWAMPFKASMAVTVSNLTSRDIALAGEFVTVKRDWTDDSMYFHAKWRNVRALPTRPRVDWNFVTVQGKGRFVGDMLHITNPVNDWWGEGDEKIYVDNEKFPSHFGTGSEDYYGYAWCCNIPFVHAYHNQPRCDGPGNRGQTCVNRFHLFDNIPFTTAFQFDIEAWHWAECKIDQSAISYWYATGDAADNFPKIAADMLLVPPAPKPRQVESALEGEKLEKTACTGGKADLQVGTLDWSGQGQLWWIDAKPGDTLTLAFDAEKAGRYEVFGAFTKAIDYGIAQLYVNGAKAGEPMDFFHKGVVDSGELSLGAFDLKAGKNELKVEIAGTNPDANPKRYMFGLDYLLLKPAG